MISVGQIAKTVFANAVTGERPTGPQLQERYGLDDNQFNRMKRLVRKQARESGILWGYYKPTGQYMVSSDNTAHGKVILDYQLKHWQDAGNAADDTFAAAAKAGVVSNRLASDVHDLATEFDPRIERLSAELDA